MANRLVSFVGARAFRTIKVRPLCTKTEEAPVDIDAIQKEFEALRKDHESLAEKYKDVQDKYRRSLAETENVRRRGQKQVEDAKIFAIQSFSKDLLEVADILDLAVESVDKSVVVSNPQIKSIYDGTVMTRDILKSTFKRNGLEIVSPEGQFFDPNMHEAVFEVPKGQAKHEPGHVEKVLKVGYSLHGRPIRAAQVGVVKK